MKRGIRAQVSVFVIIAIVLIVAGGASFYVMQKNKQSEQNKEFFSGTDVKPGMDELKNSLIKCMEDTTKDSLEMIGIQGGYNKKPEKYMDLGWTFIPYYYDQGNYYIPEKFSVEKEISDSINTNIVSCVDKIKIENLELKYSKPKTTTQITPGQVSFVVDMSMSIKQGDNSMTVQFKDLPVSYNSSLYDILEVASYITNSHKQDPDKICVTCVADMAGKRNLYVNFLNLDDSSGLVVILTNNTVNSPSYFEFLNKPSVRKDTGINIPIPQKSD